jgi:hypothetical protein
MHGLTMRRYSAVVKQFADAYVRCSPFGFGAAKTTMLVSITRQSAIIQAYVFAIALP